MARFSEVKLFRDREPGENLSVKAPSPAPKDRRAASPSTFAQVVAAASKFGAEYFKEKADKSDREKMRDILTAYRQGTTGEREIIDLPESEIIEKYGDPAAKTEYGWIDPDETEEDQAKRAKDARKLAMPELDDQGRRFTQEHFKGLAAARHVAGLGWLGPASERMLNALMMEDMEQARAKEAAKLKHQRDIELKGSPAGKAVPRTTGRGPNGILRFIDTGEPVFDQNITPSKTKFFTEENALRKDFEKGAKDFIKVRDAYGRILASASDPSAAGDLALIFNYMKVLDPGSTVREGEFATAAASAGISDRIRAQYNKIVEGERLADTQRNDFVARAGKLYSSQLTQYQLHEDYYRKVAKQYGVNPENVVYPMGAKTKINADDSELLTEDEKLELEALRKRFGKGG
jgi:hypothetical protein